MNSNFVYSGNLSDIVLMVVKCDTFTQRLLVCRFHDSEDCDDDIHCAVTLIPQLVKLVHGRIDIRLLTCCEDCLDYYRMWLIADFEHVFARDKAKARPG